MANEEEARFTFDTKPFMDGLKKIGDGFTKTFNAVKQISEKITKAVITPIKQMAQKIGGMLAVPFTKAAESAKTFVGGILSIQGAMKAMPIVGQTFDFIGDVIRRNLFAPLQQELLPLLQQLIKWVQSNRPLFVKWGQVIANVFTAVYETAKILWGILSKIFDMVAKSVQKTFGTTFKNMEELTNTIVWKMTMLMLFLAHVVEKVVSKLQPVIDGITALISEVVVHIVDFALKIANAAVQGDTFAKFMLGIEAAFEGIKAVIVPVIDGIRDLIVQLLLPDEQGNSFGDVIRDLGLFVEEAGNLIGSGISAFFDGFTTAVSGINTVLVEIVKKFRELTGMVDESGIVQKAFKGLGYLLGNIVMLILTELMVGLNSLMITFRQISVLFDGEENKLARIAALHEEGVNYSREAHGNVQIVQDVQRWIGGLNPRDDPHYGGGATVNATTGMEVHDAIITKSGQVIRTAPDDNIYAFKTLGGAKSAQAQPTEIHFGNVYITVPEGSSPAYAETLGRSAASGFSARLAQELSASLLRESF
jgi:phage-related protein